MGLQMSRPTWGPLGGHFLHPKTSFLCSDGIDTPWKSSGKQRDCSDKPCSCGGTNRTQVFPTCPQTAAGQFRQAGHQGQLYSVLGSHRAPSLGNKPELPVPPSRAHSSLHSLFHRQSTRHWASLIPSFTTIRASTDIPGLQVVQSKAAASLRASLPCAQSCLGR